MKTLVCVCSLYFIIAGILVYRLSKANEKIEGQCQVISEQSLIVDSQQKEIEELQVAGSLLGGEYYKLLEKAIWIEKENFRNRKFWKEYKGRVVIVEDPTEGFCYRPRDVRY